MRKRFLWLYMIFLWLFTLFTPIALAEFEEITMDAQDVIPELEQEETSVPEETIEQEETNSSPEQNQKDIAQMVQEIVDEKIQENEANRETEITYSFSEEQFSVIEGKLNSIDSSCFVLFDFSMVACALLLSILIYLFLHFMNERRKI